MQPTWTDILQAIGSVGGLVVAVLGFAVVIIQLHQVGKSVESETHSKLYALDFECTRFIIDRPELYKYFRNNVDIQEDDPNYVRAEEIAGLLCTHMEHVLLQMTNLPKDITPCWLDYIRGIYSTSPILRTHLRKNQEWYSPRLHDLFLGQETPQQTYPPYSEPRKPRA